MEAAVGPVGVHARQHDEAAAVAREGAEHGVGVGRAEGGAVQDDLGVEGVELGPDGREVEAVGVEVGHVRQPVGMALAPVDDEDVVTRLDELVHDPSSDEPGPAEHGDAQPHGCTLSGEGQKMP